MGVEYKVILLRLANAKKCEQNDRSALKSRQQPAPTKNKSARPITGQYLKKQYYFQPFEDWPLG